jgi:hypothetical protein
MNEGDSFQPPKPSAGDTAHLVASGILSVIPGAAELFRWFVTPPYERRQKQWMEAVAEALRTLDQARPNAIEELQSNEAFVSLVTQATIVALKNHHAEKRAALRNALLNAALSPSPGEDLQLAFIRFIDELSPSHLILLQLISDREQDVATATSYEDLYGLLSPDIPTSPSRDNFKMLCLELQSRGLIIISPDIGEFEGIYEASALLIEKTRSDLPRVKVSNIGREFMSFVAENSRGAG